jgi:hypothetical protein
MVCHERIDRTVILNKVRNNRVLLADRGSLPCAGASPDFIIPAEEVVCVQKMPVLLSGWIRFSAVSVIQKMKRERGFFMNKRLTASQPRPVA